MTQTEIKKMTNAEIQEIDYLAVWGPKTQVRNAKEIKYLKDKKEWFKTATKEEINHYLNNKDEYLCAPWYEILGDLED